MRARTIDFKRGGSEKDIRDRILDRVPRGSLFLTSGKFPYLFMLLEERGNRNYGPGGIFAHIGSFQGGGGHKTSFRFVANPPEYSWSFDTLKPLNEVRPRQLELIKEAVWSDDEGVTSWDRIAERTGVRPLIPMFEASFERAMFTC